MVEEWSRVVSQTVQVEGKEVSILITEYYTADQPGVPKSCKFSGPNGLAASSWPEMLEKLGIAPPSPPALPKASRSRVDEECLKQRSEYSQEREIATAEARESDPLVDAHGPPRMDADSKSNPSPDAANPVAVNDPPKRVLWQTRPGPFLPKNRKLRTDPKRLDEIDNLEAQMGLLWWAEQVKQGYPERYEALFDREKYQALLDREDLAEPAPEPDKAPRCTFIKSDGQTCAAYAVKNKRLCYFHSQTSDGRKKKKAEASAGSRFRRRSRRSDDRHKHLPRPCRRKPGTQARGNAPLWPASGDGGFTPECCEEGNQCVKQCPR